MPAGTVTGAPLTKTSRCACTCRKTNSCVSGVSRARTVSFIGSAGAGHGAAPFAGVGAGGAAAVGAASADGLGRAFLVTDQTAVERRTGSPTVVVPRRWLHGLLAAALPAGA